MNKWRKLGWCTLILAALTTPLWSAIIPPLPVTLQNGTTADANQVMSDFNAIVTNVNANAAPLATTAQTNITNTFTAPQIIPDGTALNHAASVAQLDQNSTKYLTDTGAANAYVVTPAPAWLSYIAGSDLFVKIGAGNTNTTSSTINVNALGVKNILNEDGSNTEANALLTGKVYHLIYDGTQFEIIGKNNTAPTVAGSDSSTKLATTGQVQAAFAIAFAYSGLPASTAGRLVLPNDYISGFTLTTASTTTYDIAAGQAIDSTNTVNIIGSALTAKSQSAWAAGSSAGGKLSAAAMANNTWYYWYAIWKTADGTVDYGFDVSSTTPTLPSGYSKFRYLGGRKTQSASTSWDTFLQHGDEVWWSTVPALDVNSANPGTAAVTATLNVPAVKVKALFNFAMSDVDAIAASSSTVYFSALENADLVPNIAATPLGSMTVFSNPTVGFLSGSHPGIWTNTSSQIRYRISTSNANISIRVVATGWVDPRGKPN